jgi:hypothetical protein
MGEEGDQLQPLLLDDDDVANEPIELIDVADDSDTEIEMPGLVGGYVLDFDIDGDGDDDDDEEDERDEEDDEDNIVDNMD